MRRTFGFTLLELIIVIVLISVLAVAVAPKFTARDSFEAHTYRASLVAALRLTQQRAMQQTNSSLCHQIVIASDGKRVGVPDRTDCSVTTFANDWQPDGTGLDIEAGDSSVIAIAGKANPSKISFNGLGVPQDDCVNGCIINVIGNGDSAQIKIEPQGYIHAL